MGDVARPPPIAGDAKRVACDNKARVLEQEIFGPVRVALREGG